MCKCFAVKCFVVATQYPAQQWHNLVGDVSHVTSNEQCGGTPHLLIKKVGYVAIECLL